MTRITILPLLVCLSCVPYQQQLLESEQAEIEGYIGPLVIDEEKFYQVASSEIFDKATIPEEYLPTSNYYTYDGLLLASAYTFGIVNAFVM